MMIMTGDRKQLSSSTVFTHTYFSILFSLHPAIQMLLGVAFKAQSFIQNAAGYLSNCTNS